MSEGTIDQALQHATDLLHNGEIDAALQANRKIESCAGNNANALKRAAEIYVHCGRHEDAHRCQRLAAAINPDDPETVFGLAASSVAIGELTEAEGLYDRLIFLNPDDHDAWYNRSTLRRQTPKNNHLKELSFVLQQLPTEHPGRVPIAYALAKECEDLERYDEAFQYLQRGASNRRARLSYDIRDDEQTLAAIEGRHTAAWLGSGKTAHDSNTPVFVLGLPRSGTTLVERIINTHSQVLSLGETNTMAMSLSRLVKNSRGRLELLEAASTLDPATLGADYCRGLAAYGESAPRLLDKTPLNFLYLGLIRAALPRAKVIHLRRNAMDSCYAMYKTLFRMGYPFSYSLQDVGRYYLAYHRLMAHWRRVMPGFFLDVDYEQLVAHPEPESRRIIEFLDLEWEPDCLNFHQQNAPSATASAAQVRQPIHTRSVYLWKKYQRQLGPLANKLAEHGIAIT